MSVRAFDLPAILDGFRTFSAQLLVLVLVVVRLDFDALTWEPTMIRHVITQSVVRITRIGKFIQDSNTTV